MPHYIIVIVFYVNYSYVRTCEYFRVLLVEILILCRYIVSILVYHYRTTRRDMYKIKFKYYK